MSANDTFTNGWDSWHGSAMHNVEVTGAARLYRAASGGPQGYAF
jgi:hypothetical protein